MEIWHSSSRGNNRDGLEDQIKFQENGSKTNITGASISRLNQHTDRPDKKYEVTFL